MPAPRLTLLAVHAHPDDESFSMGGTLARAADEGIRTVLVCATRGEAGEIHDPDLAPDDARGRLGAIREQELRRACAILGINDLRFLGYRDSGMVGTPENADPSNFHNADVDQAVRRVVHILREMRPAVVVTYDERGGYGHPDHIAAHRVTHAAVSAAADPSRFADDGLAPWTVTKLYHTAISRSAFARMVEVMRERGIPQPFDGPDFDIANITQPDDMITTSIDVRDQAGRKRSALLAHRTQIGNEAFQQLLSNDDGGITELWGHETFIRVHPSVSPGEQETDLFAGMR